MPRKVLIESAPESRRDADIQVEVTLALRPRRDQTRAHGGSVLTPASRPRIPRITRLMALAIKLQDMVDRSEVRDYADLARVGHVTRARMSQIMNLTLLAPDIQESVLLPGATLHGITERSLREITMFTQWEKQRRTYLKHLS